MQPTNDYKDKVIVFTTNGEAKPLRWLELAIRTAMRCLEWDVRFVIYTDDPSAVEAVLKDPFHFSSNRMEIVDARPTIKKYGMERLGQCEFHGKHITPMQMFRLALPVADGLEKYDRVVFVDSDVVFRSSMWGSIFFEPDMEDYDVAGVQNSRNRMDCVRNACTKLLKNGAAKSAPKKNLRRIANCEYVAAGVMLMNLKRLRAKNHGNYGGLLRKMIRLCAEYRPDELDQSLVNLFFDIKFINAAYNAWFSTVTNGENVWLWHEAGPKKIRTNFYPPTNEYVPQDTVDIVYVVGPKSAHDDMELRWSLRTIAKNGVRVGRVIVVSPERREWLSDEVTQVVCADVKWKRAYKHHQNLNAILNVITALNLHGEFLVSSDDHFYLRPTDFTKMPFYYKSGQIWTKEPDDEPHPRSTSDWFKSVIATERLLRKHGLPTVNFQQHCNSHWNADLVRDNLKLFTEAMLLPKCVEPHLLMQNLWLSKQPSIPLKYRQDNKWMEWHNFNPSQVESISISDQIFVDPTFLGFMDKWYGRKCRYER